MINRLMERYEKFDRNGGSSGGLGLWYSALRIGEKQKKGIVWIAKAMASVPLTRLKARLLDGRKLMDA